MAIKKEVLIIGGVEIAFGILEGIVLPNVIHRKKGDPWVIPNKKEIVETVTTLTITGFASGYLANYVLEQYKIADDDKRRPYIIAGTAIAVNVIESILVPNIVGRKFDGNYKFELPKLKVFAASMAVLTVTALMGGYVSDNIIASLNKGGSADGQVAMATEPVVVEKKQSPLATI